MFVVVKADCVSSHNDSDEVDEYISLNENDDLSTYSGGSVHLRVSSGLLESMC